MAPIRASYVFARIDDFFLPSVQQFSFPEKEILFQLEFSGEMGQSGLPDEMGSLQRQDTLVGIGEGWARRWLTARVRTASPETPGPRCPLCLTAAWEKCLTDGQTTYGSAPCPDRRSLESITQTSSSSLKDNNRSSSTLFLQHLACHTSFRYLRDPDLHFLIDPIWLNRCVPFPEREEQGCNFVKILSAFRVSLSLRSSTRTLNSCPEKTSIKGLSFLLRPRPQASALRFALSSLDLFRKLKSRSSLSSGKREDVEVREGEGIRSAAGSVRTGLPSLPEIPRSHPLRCKGPEF